jgi:predicted DNA-binding protein (UPF0278 family)
MNKRKLIEKRIADLRKKYQPQWHFKNVKSAVEGLNFQKNWNPNTYRWLLRKDIKVNGRRVPARLVMNKVRKVRRRTTKSPWESIW